MALITSVFINLFLNQAMVSPDNINYNEFVTQHGQYEMKEGFSDRLSSPTTPRITSDTATFTDGTSDQTVDEIVVSLVNTIGRWRRNLQRSALAKNRAESFKEGEGKRKT